jgi:glyoxylase-like metal-dependent hydrolase (beta-lactamase superfamily II)
MCISTHFHDDRTAGLQYFNTKEIKTYSSKKTLDLCKKENNKQALNFFTKDTLFESGNYKFETFFAGEGHSKDNIVIWFPNEKILYGGCLIKSTESDGLGNISDANLSEWKSTIRKLIKKYPNPKYVIPGHFGWSSRKSLLHTLKLLRQY